MHQSRLLATDVFQKPLSNPDKGREVPSNPDKGVRNMYLCRLCDSLLYDCDRDRFIDDGLEDIAEKLSTYPSELIKRSL